MCRFALYHGPAISLSSLLTEPSHSLIHQSTHSLEMDEPLNGDGFGVAWYVPEVRAEPAVFRSITPAWNNRNLLSLSGVVRSGCVLAHVRAATAGLPVNEANCHPFTHKRFAFMHNGDLGGFRLIRRRLLEELSDDAFDVIGGSTDSEHLFALFVEQIIRSGRMNEPGHLAEALGTTLRRAVELSRTYGDGSHSYLNMAVSDGKYSAVCRFSTDPNHISSLYVNRGRRYICEGGVCRMISASPGGHAVVVSSERLSDDETWEPIPANHILAIAEDRGVKMTPCNIEPQEGKQAAVA